MTIWIPVIAKNEARPLYVAIAQAIEADILSGRLKPGDQLPTHRDLADRLKVTVGTVSRGYNEARKAGWISGEIGRGTYILDRNAGRFPAAADDTENVIDLSLNVPVDSSELDLGAALRGMSAAADVQSLLRYTPTDTHRAKLAGRMVLERHGLAVDADKIVLCAGTQHGIGVALDAVTRSGDCILAEELTYPAFKPLAEARGLRTYAVALDEQGIVPSALHAACRKVHPKALYIVPTLHNPTTGTLSASRRRELVEVARRHDLIIIEDDVYRMLADEAPPPIARLAPERTVYVTSLSKSFAPGLRVGYLVGPAAQYNNLVSAVQHSIWMLSPITTELAARWVIQGEFDSIVAGKRKEAAARHALAAKLLPRQRVRAAKTSYHLWLSTGVNADAFTLMARERGVLVTPASAFYLGSVRPPDAVRVSLSAARDRSILVTALERLRDLLERPGASISPRL